MPVGPLLCRAFARRCPVWPAAELGPGARQVRSRGKVLVGLGTGRASKNFCTPRAPPQKRMFLPWVHLGRRARPWVYLRKIYDQKPCCPVPGVWLSPQGVTAWWGVMFIGWSARCRNSPGPMRIATGAAWCALKHRKIKNGVLAKMVVLQSRNRHMPGRTQFFLG